MYIYIKGKVIGIQEQYIVVVVYIRNYVHSRGRISMHTFTIMKESRT